MGVGGASAGFWIGRFIGETIHATAAAVISLPAMAAGPMAYGIACTSTYATMAPLMEGPKQAGSLAAGIVGSVATGPV